VRAVAGAAGDIRGFYPERETCRLFYPYIAIAVGAVAEFVTG
jgi:hypothetical protein